MHRRLIKVWEGLEKSGKVLKGQKVWKGSGKLMTRAYRTRNKDD